MDADEGTIEALTEPVAIFGVDNPMLEELAIFAASELPRVKSIEELSSAFLAQTHLYTYIRRSSSIVQKIRLQRDLLGSDGG